MKLPLVSVRRVRFEAFHSLPNYGLFLRCLLYKRSGELYRYLRTEADGGKNSLMFPNSLAKSSFDLLSFYERVIGSEGLKGEHDLDLDITDCVNLKTLCFGKNFLLEDGKPFSEPFWSGAPLGTVSVRLTGVSIGSNKTVPLKFRAEATTKNGKKLKYSFKLLDSPEFDIEYEKKVINRLPSEDEEDFRELLNQRGYRIMSPYGGKYETVLIFDGENRAEITTHSSLLSSWS
jgi:hypothetical protein